MTAPAPLHNVVLALGDQLDVHSSVFADFDAKRETVWMVEVAHETDQVWSTKARIAMFQAAMRHFRDALRECGFAVHRDFLSRHEARFSARPRAALHRESLHACRPTTSRRSASNGASRFTRAARWR